MLVLAVGPLAGCTVSSADSTSDNGTTDDEASDAFTITFSGCQCGPLWEALMTTYTEQAGVEFALAGRTHCADAVTGVEEGALHMACVGSFPEDLADGMSVNDDLIYAAIAHDALVVGVSTDVGPVDLTTAELTAIYTGEVTNWEQLGGPDLEVWIGDRLPDRSSRPVAEVSLFDEPLPILDTAVVLDHEENVIDFVADQSGAVGYFSLGLCTFKEADVAFATIGGVAATRESVIDHTYPATRHRGFIVRRDAAPEVLAFIDWVASPQAMAIVEDAGYLSAAACPE